MSTNNVPEISSMLDLLNDDCLLHIISFLKLNDQLNLKEISPRLAFNVHRYWRHETKHTVELEQFNSQQSLVEYLREISSNTQQLELRRVSLEQLRLWLVYQFPKLKHLNFHYGYTENGHEPGAHVLMLSKLFPTLTTLELCSGTTGEYLWLFTQLVELRLVVCEEIEPRYFERIFTALKQLRSFSLLCYGYSIMLLDDEHFRNIALCKTLEEIELDDHHLLNDMLERLLALPKLRQISFYTRDYHEYIVSKISKLRGPDVHTVMYYDVFWSSDKHFNALFEMHGLKRLVLHEDDIECEQLERFSSFKSLTEFHWTNYRSPIGEELLELFSCYQLEILNVSRTKILKKFLIEAQSEFLARLDRRKTPLKLYCHDSGLSEPELKAILNHPMLHITIKDLKVDLPKSSRFMKIKFTPHETSN